MRERGAAVVAARKLALAEMHAVREHRAPAGQAVVGIDVEIVAPLGKQLRHPRDLVPVLGDVGLHEHVRDARATGCRQAPAARACWSPQSAA